MRLAYLTTEYPKASHTFIRREILALEARGHVIDRVALRRGESKDPADALEATRTTHLLSEPKVNFLRALAELEATRPLRFARAMKLAVTMSRPSDRGLLRHAGYLAEAARLTRILEDRSVQHVHVHFGTNAASVARLVHALGGPTYSFTVHGPDEWDSPRGHSLSGKVADAAFVIGISDFCSAQLRRWAAYEDWSKIHVVHCTVGDHFFGPIQPIPPASRTILSVGRLSAQKGQLLLLDALSALVHAGEDVRLVLAGDGEMRSVVERRIAELGLSSRVTITGWIGEAEVQSLLVESRALVLPSFAEGLPVVIMEALAMGRPVVSTLIAGIPELVREGENGWLVPAGSHEALVAALRKVMAASMAELEALGRAGRKRVEAEHSSAIEAQKLERLFSRYTAA